MLTTLVPATSDVRDVLPTERLLDSGVAIPELRARFRTISTWRNVRAVLMAWVWLIGLTYCATHTVWYVTLLAFIAMGPIHVRFAILMHEAAHRLLFRSKRINDAVGTWLIAYPAFVPISLYRRSHFAHHRDEFGPDEPDIAFYDGYPCHPRDLRRRLWRDALGISGWKNFKVLLTALTKPASRPLATRILGVQVVLAVSLWAMTSQWWAYFVMWWLPWMTQWRVLNRLRAIGEHGGMQRSDDRRFTTHHVRQTWLARVWLVPFRTGWHLAHHVDMGVPWHQLPAFHAELVRAGYVTDEITFRNYTALWRAATAQRD